MEKHARKPDEAHVWTDAELEKLERRIAAEYKRAADELTDKINAYFKSFKKRDEETKALIGTIVNGREYTEQDYQKWRLAQIGRGKRFEALRDRVAERMTKANEVAAANVKWYCLKLKDVSQCAITGAKPPFDILYCYFSLYLCANVVRQMCAKKGE